jgi:opacity protein-like surface antigen
MKRLRTAALLFLPLLALAATPGAQAGVPEVPALTPPPASRSWDIALTLDTGWRHDNLQWTIAGDTSGRHPNILSDLDWTELEIIPASLTADVTLQDHWRVRLSGSYGWIVDGRNRDSDYDFNDRKGEFSRSYADTTGRTIDAEIALGYDLPPMARAVTLTPWLGLSYHQQHLNDRNGVQVVDTEFGDLGPFGGLDSVYEAEWFGVVFGLEACVRLGDTTRLTLGGRYELITYEAEADWNLRTDFEGFDHHADGDGWRLAVGFEWDFAPRWTLGLRAEWSLFETDAGIDHTDFTDGTSIDTQLNEVKWESVGLRAGIVYRF